MASILSPVPIKDRCTKNLPDGGHLWKLPTFPGYPKRCAYCGRRQPAQLGGAR